MLFRSQEEIISRRVKPWGTTHALLSAENNINEPLCIINADDYYGADSMQKMFDFLKTVSKPECAMIGFELQNTLSEHGSVSRGLCVIENGYLKTIHEHTKIVIQQDSILSQTNNQLLEPDCIVSMNMWGMQPEIMPMAKAYFKDFVLKTNEPETAECYLPVLISALIDEEKIRVKVLKAESDWIGITYAEDLDIARQQFMP